MRWVLTIKKDTNKAKARLVALGFQDRDLGHVKTASPTASNCARSIWCQVTANKKLEMFKAGAKGDFPQEINSILKSPSIQPNNCENLMNLVIRNVFCLLKIFTDLWVRPGSGTIPVH